MKVELFIGSGLECVIVLGRAGIMWKRSGSGPDLQAQAKGQMTEGSRGLSNFDGLKTTPMSPEALMAEINNAISNLEYARATAFLDSLSDNNKSSDADGSSAP